MRYGWLSSLLSKQSMRFIIVEFALVYCGLAIIFGLVYWRISSMMPDSFKQGQLCLLQSFYFSFIAQSTSGFGDIIPVGDLAKAIAVFQGIIGLIFSGLWVGVLTAKWFTAGESDSIYFADWAGYSLEEQRFFILFVNRNVDKLVDVNINSAVKLGGYMPVPPSVNPPYFGHSAWTFGIQGISVDDLRRLEISKGDGIKVYLSATAGMTRYSNSHEYEIDKIYVLQDRSYYWSDIFENPKFDAAFFDNFARPPNDAIPFRDFLRRI